MLSRQVTPCLPPAGRYSLGLLWPRRRWGTIAVLLVWATAVMGSRPALGMHWPLDLIVATLISGCWSRWPAG